MALKSSPKQDSQTDRIRASRNDCMFAKCSWQICLGIVFTTETISKVPKIQYNKTSE